MQTATANFNPHDHAYPAINYYWRALMIVRGESVDTPIIAMIPHLLIDAALAETARQAFNAAFHSPEAVAARAEEERKKTGSCVRPDPLDENEIALFQRLKLITDTKKLQSRLPAWIKKHQKSGQPPKPFEFIEGAKPVYPANVKAMFTRQSDTGLDRAYPEGYSARRPECTWREGMSTAQYIAAFYALNPNAGGRSAGTVLYSNVN